jgi:hypothetical protein
LPTESELAGLPLRAIVAYAARTARRVSKQFRGIIPDEVLDETLARIDCVWKESVVKDTDSAAIANAAYRVATVYSETPAERRSDTHFFLLFSLVQAAIAASAVADAIHDSRVMSSAKRVAGQAERAVRPIKALSGGEREAAFGAAFRDYETLLKRYGAQEVVVIGEPVDCFWVE